MRLASLAGGVLVALSALGPALAFEPTGNAVADAFLGVVRSAGYGAVDVGGVRREGGRTVLSQVVAQQGVAPETAAEGSGGESTTGQASPGTGRLTIGEVAIEGGLVDADNALVARTVSYADLAVTGEDTRARAGLIVVGGPRLAPTDGAGWIATLTGAFETVEADDLSAEPPGGQAVRVERIALARTPSPADEEVNDAVLAGRLLVRGADLDVATFEGPAAAFLRDLGYGALKADVALEGRWDGATGRLDLGEATLGADALGRLTIAATLDGLSRDNAAALSNVADFARLLDLLEGVQVSALAVSYGDDGLVDRLIGRAAEARGVSREALIAGLVSAASSALGQLGDEEFSRSIGETLARFLADPGTLRVEARPSAAVSMAQVLGGVLMRPDILPRLLNITVTAEP